MGYDDFPPYDYFLIALRNCPNAALLYAVLWDKRDETDSVWCHRKLIGEQFLMSPDRFNSMLMSLACQGLLSMRTTIEGLYCIQLVEYEDEDENE